MLKEDMEIFCGILSDAYYDSYIEASWDFCELDGKLLDLGFEQFKKKKQQISALKQGKLTQVHFEYKEKATDSILLHEKLFEQMKDCLSPYNIISNGLQLKRAYFAWTWLLKGGVYVPKNIQKRLDLLEVQIDNRPLSKKEKKHIAIQAIAQVIGYKNGYFDTQKMKTVILRYPGILPTLFHLYDWPSIREYQNNQASADPSNHKDVMRDIEKLIASVRPSRTEGHKSIASRKEEQIQFIPGIFEEKNIHFPKLLRALTNIIVMLISIKVKSRDVSSHPILEKYRQNLPTLFHGLIEQHIQDATKDSVAFFS